MPQVDTQIFFCYIHFMGKNRKTQQTLVIIKPDGLKKSLTGNILTKLSEARLTIVGARMCAVSTELAREHYKHLSKEPFFKDLIRYIRGEFHNTRRVMALVYAGENAIELVRKIAGATNPEEADPTTIRGAYGRITTKGIYENVIHASSDENEAMREIQLWFEPSEIVSKIYPTRRVLGKPKPTEVWR